jgi:hydrogenase-4 component E
MWIQALDPLLVFVLLLNFFVLATNRLPHAILLVGLQGVINGVMPALIHQSLDSRSLLLVAMTIVVKGIVIPKLLHYAIREIGIQRDIHPIFGFIPGLLLGTVGTGLALAFSSTLPLREADTAAGGHLIVPASLSTVLTGYLILTTRWRALSQALGYLVLENGIFIFGLLLVEAMPFLVEAGVLLDLFVGVFVMGIIIQHITRGFDSDSTRHLSALKE